ncbi:MAG TPA: YdcF family protein [Terrimicrobiaceae bacterium]
MTLILFLGLAFLGALLGVLVASMRDLADYAANADCIVVLGAAIRGSSPTPVFEERIRHGVDLYRNGMAAKIVFTGGFGDGQKHSESSVAAAVAGRLGVPVASVLIEEKSRTTRQNLAEALEVMRQNGLHSAIIVSDPLHMKRAMMMAEDLGIEAFSSPTPTTRYRSFRARLVFLIREIYFFHHYLITGD